MNNIPSHLIEGRIMNPLDDTDFPGIYDSYSFLSSHFSKANNGLNTPQLEIISSVDASNALVSDTAGKQKYEYLIFDYHSIDLMGELNEVLMASPPTTNAADPIIYRIISEKLLINGRLKSSFCYANRFKKIAKPSVSMTPEARHIRSQMLLFEQRFILCHELCHWLYRHQGPEMDNIADFERFFEEKLAIKKKNKETNGIEYYKQAVELLPKVITELSCDIRAVSFLLTAYKDSKEVSIIDIATYAYLALQHLLMLSYAGRLFQKDRKGNAERTSFTNSMRMLACVEYMHPFISRCFGDDISRQYVPKLSSIRDKYTKIIMNPLMSKCRDALQVLPLYEDLTTDSSNIITKDIILRELAQ